MCFGQSWAGKVQQLWFGRISLFQLRRVKRFLLEQNDFVSEITETMMANWVLPEISTEQGQFHQIGFRHRFEGMPGFAPGAKAPRDDEGAKSLLSQ